MDLLELMSRHGLEEVVAVSDPATGLLGFIVIHDTTRGPGIGGCRLAPYPDAAAALADAVALATTMTRKCALAGLNAGGAKGVFIGRADQVDSGAMFRALGRFVESLGGRFYTSGDLGVGRAALREMRKTTRYVAVPDDDRLDLAGAVAEGVLSGMRAALSAAGRGPELVDRVVLVQGLGTMGERVARRLVAAGAKVVASDRDALRAGALAEELRLRLVPPEAIFDEPADVFCPCAVGGVLTAEVVARLQVAVVAGAANNALGDASADAALHARGILYAPDFAINSGAVVLAAREYLERGASGQPEIERAATQIGDTVRRIFERSRAANEPTGSVADRMASEALVRPKSTEQMWWPVT